MVTGSPGLAAPGTTASVVSRPLWATVTPSSMRLIAPLTRFMRGEPMKPATNRLAGPVIERERRPDLLDDALVDDDDLGGERHRLDLVVGDVDGRRLELAMQPGDLDARVDAQRRVEIGERLVEEEDGRLADDRPADGDPLPLAARKVARLAGEIRA